MCEYMRVFCAKNKILSEVWMPNYCFFSPLLNAAGKQLRHVDNDGENWEGGTD